MGKTRIATFEEKKESEKKPKKKPQKKSLKDEKGVRVPGLKGGERVISIGTELIDSDGETRKDVKNVKEEKKREAKQKIRGKKYISAQAKVNKNTIYKLDEAIKLAKTTSTTNFDATIELHLVVKKTGTSTNVSLPNSFGKKKKVEIADDKTIAKLKEGHIDFDVLLATADMMPKLVPFAKTLGPKGLMPNPKNGTLIKTKSEAKAFSANTLTLKTEKDAPLIHTVIGKVSQKDSQLIKNLEAILEGVGKNQILKAFLTSTMGPSIKLDL